MLVVVLFDVLPSEPGRKRIPIAHCLLENYNEPVTRENRAKLKCSSKYSTPYIPIEESGTVDPLSPRKRLATQ